MNFQYISHYDIAR